MRCVEKDLKMAKFNICLVQPDNYIHSLAFWELGELILYALKEMGHDADLAFNKVDIFRQNILIGFHLLNEIHLQEFPSSTIILNTEQIYLENNNWTQKISKWISKFKTWDYSERNIQKLREYGQRDAKLLKIGFQKELKRIGDETPKDVDVLFYGSYNDRRRAVLDRIRALGLNATTLFGVYGQERDTIIAKSKLVLNHHYYTSEIFEVVRVFYLLTNGIPVVGEVNQSTDIDDIYRSAIAPAPYDEIPDLCEALVRDDDRRRNLGLNGQKIIEKFPQRNYLEEIL